MGRRLLLQSTCPDRLGFDLDPGCLGSRGILVARLVRHSGDHAGKHKHRDGCDDDQNDCVGSHVGPSVW
jgi:hypothetical protein